MSQCRLAYPQQWVRSEQLQQRHYMKLEQRERHACKRAMQTAVDSWMHLQKPLVNCHNGSVVNATR
jgi:hypothetical protein